MSKTIATLMRSDLAAEFERLLSENPDAIGLIRQCAAGADGPAHNAEVRLLEALAEPRLLKALDALNEDQSAAKAKGMVGVVEGLMIARNLAAECIRFAKEYQQPQPEEIEK